MKRIKSVAIVVNVHAIKQAGVKVGHNCLCQVAGNTVGSHMAGSIARDVIPVTK